MAGDYNEIVVSGETRLSEIRDAFADYYPFLMIGFAHQEQYPAASSLAALSLEKPSDAFARMGASYAIDVSSQRSVVDVVRDFSDLFGVQIQMYRKSGSVWNLILYTDSWSLRRQNDAGEYVSRMMRGVKDE